MATEADSSYSKEELQRKLAKIERNLPTTNDPKVKAHLTRKAKKYSNLLASMNKPAPAKPQNTNPVRRTIKLKKIKPTATTTTAATTTATTTTTNAPKNLKPPTPSKSVSPSKMNSDPFTALTKDPIPFLETQTTDQIATLLRTAAEEYYKGTPKITDDIYDITRTFLAQRDPKHPALQEIGAAAPGEKVQLPFWMGSLDKIKEDEAALNRWKTAFPGEIVLSDKLDGNSALLILTPGAKPRMYSRGDGYQGQDISHVLPLIQGIPKTPPPTQATIAVRGELIISKANWEAKGKGANARNAVAGVMHSKHPDKALASIVEFVAYEQLQPRVKASEGLKALEALGFKAVWHSVAKTKDLTQENLSRALLSRRKESPYEVDGIVIFHDAPHNQVAGKNPSYAFAFKSILTHEEAEVMVSQVEWNASKDGYLKPLVHFPPVVLAGATIAKATGFNALFIQENKIGPGSRLVIIRSGDVIPHIHKILSAAASGSASMPDQAKTPWEWNATHVDAVLKDISAAADVTVKRMEYFATKLEMKGVGEGIVKRLYAGGIDSIPKMLAATETDILKLDGFQAKSAAKVVKEIRDAVQRADCLTFMHASNLFGRAIGSTKLKTIVSAYPNILEGKVPTEAQVAGISGIGPVTARQFLDALPAFFEFMDEIGVPCSTPKAKAKPATTVAAPPSSAKSLVGQAFVFTGIRDKDLEAAIEARGGKVATSVSGKTTVVIAKNPADQTGKVKEAIERGIPVVDIETFKKNYL